MNEKANDPLTHIATDFFSTVLKATEQSLRQGQLAFSREQPLAWNQSTPWHTADATLRMEPDGNISLSLTVRPKDSSTQE